MAPFDSLGCQSQIHRARNLGLTLSACFKTAQRPGCTVHLRRHASLKSGASVCGPGRDRYPTRLASRRILNTASDAAIAGRRVSSQTPQRAVHQRFQLAGEASRAEDSVQALICALRLPSGRHWHRKRWPRRRLDMGRRASEGGPAGKSDRRLKLGGRDRVPCSVGGSPTRARHFPASMQPASVPGPHSEGGHRLTVRPDAAIYLLST